MAYDASRKRLWWVRSLDGDTVTYRIDQRKDGDDWRVIDYVEAIAGRWQYEYWTVELDDLATYAWRVVPIDQAGNEGAALELGPTRIVRRPVGPVFTATFDDGTKQVTFSAS